MSRVRTGHGPQDWSAPDDGRPARVEGGFFGGQLVVGDPGAEEKQRLSNKKRTRYAPGPDSRSRRPPVDMNDYDRGDAPWSSVPRCGAPMKVAKQPCARTAGHRREHRSAESLEYRRHWQSAVAS